MRIGLVSYEYPPQTGLGGVGSYTFRLAGALGRAGHEVIVLAGPASAAESSQTNVTVHRLAARYDPPLRLGALRWIYWRFFARLMERANPLVWHWLRWDLASGRALREIHRDRPLDVVEAPEHAANALRVGHMGRWPLVLRTHGPWDLFFGINRTDGAALNHLLAAAERHSARYAQVITSPSRTMARFIRRRWHLDDPPLVTPNFMDVPDRPPPLADWRASQRILCAGRLERFKGQDVLVAAFAQIAAAHPRARLVLIGPDQWSRKGTFADEVVSQFAPDPAVRGRIELLGRQPLARIQEELAQAAIAVVPSSGFESFSYSTLESLAAGRPTIVTRAGAMPELVDYGRCGLIVPPGDPPRLAGALDRLLSDRALCQRLARAAHGRAREHYNTAVAIPQFLAAYERAIALRACPVALAG